MFGLFEKIAIAESHPKVDLIEIWLDSLEDLNIEKIFEFRKKPLIAVCKRPNEMGEFFGSDAQKTAMLVKFIELGGEYIDISNDNNDLEFFQYFKRNYKVKIVGSFHDFARTPSFEELNEIIEHKNHFDCDIIKIATMINTKNDIKILEKSIKKILELKKLPIVLGMGEKGKTIRLSEGIFKKNYLTFVALSENDITAEGQINLNEI